jgi:hypothetical protein
MNKTIKELYNEYKELADKKEPLEIADILIAMKGMFKILSLSENTITFKKLSNGFYNEYFVSISKNSGLSSVVVKLA